MGGRIMKKSFIIAIFLVAILLLLSACSKPQPTSDTGGEVVKSNTNSETESGSGDGSIVNSLENIFKLGGKYQCTFTTADGAESTMYIQGENYRMEATRPEGTSYIVLKKEGNNWCNYIWSDQADSPVLKSCVSESEFESGAESTTSDSGRAQAPSSDVQVNCRPYVGSVDLSVPSGRQVVDLQQLASGFGAQA